MIDVNTQRIRLRHILPTACFVLAGSALAAPPQTSAYFTDAQHSYVQDETSESIGQVNMIACVMSAMRPDALVNKGPYIALVDQNKCDAAKRSSSSNSGGGDGATQAANYMTATVDSTRASNNDPMIVKAWIAMDDGAPMTIFVHISATESPSTTNPYGAFRLDFCGKQAGATGACMMNGFMQGGSGVLSYYQTETAGGGGSGPRTTALQLTSVGTSTGSGSLSMQQSNGGSTQSAAFNFAYDASYFLRDNGNVGGAQCFARDATDPATGLSVWRYGLYDSTTGAHVDLNSGFPIEYTPTGSSTPYQGFLGYWGLSLPSAAAATLASGSTVQKVDYSSSGGAPTKTSYSVLKNGGRLTRYTRKTRTLHEMDQIHFTAWVGAAGGTFPTPNSQYEMYWDEATSRFKVTGEIQCGQNGCQTASLASVLSVDPSFWYPGGGVQGWSQSLGGAMFIDLHGLSGAPVSSAVTVVYRAQDLVYPGDPAVATLYCITDCPSAASLSNYFNQGGTPVASPFVAGTFNNWSPVAQAGVRQYSVDSNGVLIDGNGAAVALTDPNVFQAFPQYQNGVHSGRLFTSLATASCLVGNTPMFCDSNVNDATVYYVWETGPNNWNQFVAVKDSAGSFVHFDSPLQVNFTVPNSTGYGAYAGKSLVLEYGGFGNLWGIPGDCVSAQTNLPMDCSAPGARYVPQFVIPYDPNGSPQQGVVTASGTGGTTSYLVKWLEREIRFARKPLASCQADNLAAPTGVVLPTSAQLKNPSDTASDVFVGTQPTVTGAARVIQGEVKY